MYNYSAVDYRLERHFYVPWDTGIDLFGDCDDCDDCVGQFSTLFTPVIDEFVPKSLKFVQQIRTDDRT